MLSEKPDIIRAPFFLGQGAGFDLAKVGSFCRGVAIGGVEENVRADYSAEFELNSLIDENISFRPTVSL
jgi:hypothetical protein